MQDLSLTKKYSQTASSASAIPSTGHVPVDTRKQRRSKRKKLGGFSKYLGGFFLFNPFLSFYIEKRPFYLEDSK